MAYIPNIIPERSGDRMIKTAATIGIYLSKGYRIIFVNASIKREKLQLQNQFILYPYQSVIRPADKKIILWEVNSSPAIEIKSREEEREDV